MNTKKIVTHNGKFHADEIFAVATIMLWLGDGVEVVRSRDQAIIDSGDYVFDVGFVYDPSKNRFDHHQKEGAGRRENGIPYASFGLAWKNFGEKLSGSIDVLNLVDKKLVQPIDAFDNGIAFAESYTFNPYKIGDAIDAFNITLEEDENDSDKNFMKMVVWAKEIIKREILHAKLFQDHKMIVNDIFSKSLDKRLVVFDSPYKESSVLDILVSYEEPLFYVMPIKRDNKWKVKTILEPPNSFKSRKYFPESWAGLQEEDLQNVTGVKDAYFCHINRFIAVAKSKEGAIKLAKLALEA